ncbi:hypothetical protein GCM10010995_26790 [Cysteiniphilum litorale]|uniref:Uncharacterized protein n=1 Tax=Cysteiniphilum litorale TaxID=2056700 RepID=A0A8J3EAD7_9GAMM|nr:hypothetical protein GCM10010995_26790 [Cysteiniphilum litorale]
MRIEPVDVLTHLSCQDKQIFLKAVETILSEVINDYGRKNTQSALAKTSHNLRSSINSKSNDEQ